MEFRDFSHEEHIQGWVTGVLALTDTKDGTSTTALTAFHDSFLRVISQFCVLINLSTAYSYFV